VMTDHFIRRDLAGPAFLAPRSEREPVITRIEAGDDLYAVVAYVRATNGSNAGAVARLEQLLVARKPPEIEPYLDLASAQLRQRQWPALERTALHILEREPSQELAREWLVLARLAADRDRVAAGRALAQLTRPEALFNAGVLLADGGRASEAIPLYERVLAQRPNLTAAWVRLGDARLECGDRLRAVDAYREALQIDPGHVRARAAIVEAFRAMGNVEEAERYRTVATGRTPGTSG
jgi:tetratricopeptide (TPR) repeat protein